MLKMPLAHNREMTAAIVPSMRWDGKEKFSSWQERGRAKLTELLGLPFEKCDDKFRIDFRVDHDDYNETRFLFQSEEGFFVPCHFWVPKKVSGRAAEKIPLVICLQGHSKGMHISMGRAKYPGDEETIRGGDRDFAVRAIREGYCALMMEQRCFGELGGTEKGPDCSTSTLAAFLIGRTTLGERVWDLQRTLDVTFGKLTEIDAALRIDKNRIICMGNSGGGTTTLFASGLEPRITHIMPSSFFCSFDDCLGAMNHCACSFVPGIRKFMDMGELAGFIAPRPFVAVSGIADYTFPQTGVYKAFTEAQRLYEGAGAADKIKLVIGEEGHRFYADKAWEAMNSFLKQGAGQ